MYWPRLLRWDPRFVSGLGQQSRRRGRIADMGTGKLATFGRHVTFNDWEYCSDRERTWIICARVNTVQPAFGMQSKSFALTGPEGFAYRPGF